MREQNLPYTSRGELPPRVANDANADDRHVDLVAHERRVRLQSPLGPEGAGDLDVEHPARRGLRRGVGDRECVVVGEVRGDDGVGRGRLAHDVAAHGLGRAVLGADRLRDRQRRGSPGRRGRLEEREEEGDDREDRRAFEA